MKKIVAILVVMPRWGIATRKPVETAGDNTLGPREGDCMVVPCKRRRRRRLHCSIGWDEIPRSRIIEDELKPGLHSSALRCNLARYCIINSARITRRFTKAYMSTQREVFEGQTKARRAKRGGLWNGGPGVLPQKFTKNLYCKWCNLSCSCAIFVNTISL